MVKRCDNCEQFYEWQEYGDVLGDCGNKDAWAFIGTLDGVKDPGEAGCPYYTRRENV